MSHIHSDWVWQILRSNFTRSQVSHSRSVTTTRSFLRIGKIAGPSECHRCHICPPHPSRPGMYPLLTPFHRRSRGCYHPGEVQAKGPKHHQAPCIKYWLKVLNFLMWIAFVVTIVRHCTSCLLILTILTCYRRYYLLVARCSLSSIERRYTSHLLIATVAILWVW